MKKTMLLAVAVACTFLFQNASAQDNKSLEKEKKETTQRINNDKERRVNVGNTNAVKEANDAKRTIRNATEGSQVRRAEKNYNAGRPQDVQQNRRPNSEGKVKQAY